ncbi:hypothetical protein KSP40_PGU017323 [Platanthera guangdongensis]|uniref:Uncharacterized protein n=1 Tax=Platanthera guangdongensis TaxID=2320717 RepID=A0ABR2MVT7_9ASPA
MVIVPSDCGCCGSDLNPMVQIGRSGGWNPMLPNSRPIAAMQRATLLSLFPATTIAGLRRRLTVAKMGFILVSSI